MNTAQTLIKPRLMLPVVFVALLGLGGCAPTMQRPTAEHRVVLQGSQEVPPVSTAATGSGAIVITPDRAISGSVTTSGINPTAAHIHEVPAGSNGPVIIPLVRTAENVWSVPAGSRLTEAQYASHRAGNLYVNVHTAVNPNGEIRGQIRN
jgi:hypothetical protein